MSVKKKAVLAYSGGLDTSYSLVRYSRIENMEVHSVIVNTGGFDSEELQSIEKRAYQLGSAKHISLDVTDEYFEKCIKYLIFGNVLKNNSYPLSVSSERMFQAMAIAKYAKEVNADYIIHGSTGAGNDQVRFDMAFQLISPNTEIITPIRDEGLTRQQEIEFLNEQGVDWPWEKAQYSINKGLWGTSIGGAETLTSDQPLPDSVFPSQPSRNEPTTISIEFKNGKPYKLNNQDFSSIEIIQKLNDLGAEYAITRDIHVGDTIVGIKGRVAFEAHAAMILIKAHHLLEKHTLTRWQLIHKEQVGSWYGTLLHEGQFMDPIMRDFESFLDSSQKRVSGKVFVQLKPYHFVLQGIESKYDLMQSKVATYGEENLAWDARDAKGFIKIFGNNLKLYHSFNE